MSDPVLAENHLHGLGLPDDSLVAGGAALSGDDRPTGPAVLNGLRCRCPACGQGGLFAGYLKTVDACPVCRTELFHHRADDGPAYLTILIVGHLLAPLILFVYTEFRPDPMVMAVLLTIFAVVLSLALLPRLKGLLIGIQWSKRMHGFADAG